MELLEPQVRNRKNCGDSYYRCRHGFQIIGILTVWSCTAVVYAYDFAEICFSCQILIECFEN